VEIQRKIRRYRRYEDGKQRGELLNKGIVTEYDAISRNTRNINTVNPKITELSITRDDIDSILTDYPNIILQEYCASDIIRDDYLNIFKSGYCFRKLDCYVAELGLKGFTMVLNIRTDRAIDIFIALVYHTMLGKEIMSGEYCIHVGTFIYHLYLDPDPDEKGYLRIILPDPKGNYPWETFCDPLFAMQTEQMKYLKL
jgi:hypothetical protein